MDVIDEAQALEEAQRQETLRRTLRAGDGDAVASDGSCIDCGRPIAPERIAALGRRPMRCAPCQDLLERRRARG